jgi:hypothetical protein
MNANSDRLKPSSTKRTLASLGVQSCRFAMRFGGLPLSREAHTEHYERGCFIGLPPSVTVVSIAAFDREKHWAEFFGTVQVNM